MVISIKADCSGGAEKKTESPWGTVLLHTGGRNRPYREISEDICGYSPSKYPSAKDLDLNETQKAAS
jgi:hypothetical protein